MTAIEEIARMRVLQRTQYATFELSNYCPKVKDHPSCWAAHSGPPRHLSSKIIEREIAWLGSIEYAEAIMLSVYNEPLSDPRFGWALDLIGRLCKWADVEVLTNGENLDQELTNWMIEHGVDRFRISCYSKEILDRVTQIDFPKTAYEIKFRSCLDDRMEWAEGTSRGDCREACLSPFRNLIIRSDGTLGTCCYDCRNELKIGDLKTSSLAELLGGDECERRYQEILKMKEGKYSFNLCRQCKAMRRIVR